MSAVGRIVRISKTVHAEVAHRFPGDPRPAFQAMHGHSLTITATIEGEVRTGVVMDMETFGAQLKEIVALIDHHFLNEISGLEMPSLENLTVWLGERIALCHGPCWTGDRRLVSVKVERPSCGEAAEWLR